MRADLRVVLDACVLAPYSLCNLLLRLAETPRLFSPIWTDDILDEVQRVHKIKLQPPWPDAISDSWRKAVNEAFPEAKVTGHLALISRLANHEKDRHVLAAAIAGKAELIVTFNLSDFQKPSLKPWKVQAIHPQDFLVELYNVAPDVVASKLQDICGDTNKPLDQILKQLRKLIPAFADYFAKNSA